MIKISFINVGQGDSIVLEWKENGENKVGLIDSNKFSDYNSTISYLEQIKPKEIKFIIMSHPHYDHYSGLLDVINYCKSKNITIRNFGLTSKTSKEYILSCCGTLVAQSELISLYETLGQMNKNGEINVGSVGTGMSSTVKLNDQLNLTFLAPSKLEEDKFIISEDYNGIAEEDINNKPLANFLSTMIKITTSDWYILLTSDCDKSTFYRVMKFQAEEFNQKLVLAQCPHHGSVLNYSDPFWKDKNKAVGTPIVFSVGTNPYKHPNETVIKKLMKHGYGIYATNRVGGLSAATETVDKSIDNSLNIYSGLLSKNSNSNYSGTQSFFIKYDGTFMPI